MFILTFLLLGPPLGTFALVLMALGSSDVVSFERFFTWSSGIEKIIPSSYFFGGVQAAITGGASELFYRTKINRKLSLFIVLCISSVLGVVFAKVFLLQFAKHTSVTAVIARSIVLHVCPALGSWLITIAAMHLFRRLRSHAIMLKDDSA